MHYSCKQLNERIEKRMRRGAFLPLSHGYDDQRVGPRALHYNILYTHSRSSL